MTERRKEARRLTCIFAGYEQERDKVEHVALIEDVSNTGAKILTRERLDVGERLDLALHLDEDMKKTSPAPARVVRCERRPAEADFWTWEAGIVFDESIERYRQAIDALHARRRAAGMSLP
jgi:hypothetical protein